MSMLRRNNRRPSFDMGTLPPDIDPTIYYHEEEYKDGYGKLTLDKSFFNSPEKTDTPFRELPGLPPPLPATYSLLNVIKEIPRAQSHVRYEYWTFSIPRFPDLHDLPGLPYMVASICMNPLDKERVDKLWRFTRESNNKQVHKAAKLVSTTQEATDFLAARRGQQWGEEWNVKQLLQHCTMGWIEDVDPDFLRAIPKPREGFDVCVCILEKQFSQYGYGGYGNGYYHEDRNNRYNNRGYNQGYGGYDGHGQRHHNSSRYNNNSSPPGGDDGYNENVKNTESWTHQEYSGRNHYHEDYNETIYHRQESPTKRRRRNNSSSESGSSTETMLSPMRDVSPEPLEASPSPRGPGRHERNSYGTRNIFEDAQETATEDESEDIEAYYSNESPSPQRPVGRRRSRMNEDC